MRDQSERENDDRFLSVREWVEVYREDLRNDGYDPFAQTTFAEIYHYGTEELAILDKVGVTDRQNLNRVIAAFIVDRDRCRDISPIIFGMQLIVNSGLTAPEMAGILGEAIAALARIDLEQSDPLERMLDDV